MPDEFYNLVSTEVLARYKSAKHIRFETGYTCLNCTREGYMVSFQCRIHQLTRPDNGKEPCKFFCWKCHWESSGKRRIT